MASETTARSEPVPASTEPPRKPVVLGLALSGGGFRATLFHLGVLQRLAELDLLRHVSVISAVSGGSVLAAHYMLLLKQELEASSTGRLVRERYLALVGRLRKQLEHMLDRQARNHLLSDPAANLSMAFLGWTGARTSMSKRMEREYQRYLYREGTEALGLEDPDAPSLGPRLRDMKVKLPMLERLDDIQQFNALPDVDCVPQLVLNSATLNTAARFTFTFSEVGDEVLGYLRFDELPVLARYRSALEAPVADGGPGSPLAAEARTADPRAHFAEHLAWWRLAQQKSETRTTLPGLAFAGDATTTTRPPRPSRPGPGEARSLAVRELGEYGEDARCFLDAPMTVLRAARVAAWHLLHWSAPETPIAGGLPADSSSTSARQGGLTRAEHLQRFWGAVRDVDQVLHDWLLRRESARHGELPDEPDWFEFVSDVYLFRVAQNFDPQAVDDLRLATAVQASANFPPVFGPMRLRGLFDSKRVRVLQLSDGGLNDNNGIEALLDARCTHVIASEAGPRSTIKSPVRWNRLGMMGQIVINQIPIVRRLLMRTLREQGRVRGALDSMRHCVLGPGVTREMLDLSRRYALEGVAFFDMDTPLGGGIHDGGSLGLLPPHPLANEISQLRTDLDGFEPVEQKALVYQGYQYCDRFVRRYLYGDLASRLPPLEPPLPAKAPDALPRTADEWEHARRVLRAGASRLGRAWRIGRARVRWVLAFAVGIVIELGLAGVGWLAVERLAQWIPSANLLEFFGRTLVVLLASVAVVYATTAVGLIPFGLWLWLDGRLATRAARPRPSRARLG